jgi:hypothetical protein
VTDINIKDEEGVVIHEHFNASKEEMWETITDPDELSAWLGGSCTIEPRVGGAVRFDLPDDGIVATGVVRGWDPPDPSRSLAGFSHTFVDQAEPNALYTCGWWLIPTSDGGCDLRFSLQAAEDSVDVELVGPWARLRVAVAADVPERDTTSVERAVELLRGAKEIVLISWVSRDIPRSLVEAGFSVVSKNGPEADDWGRAELRDGEVHFTRVDRPVHADLLHLDWTIGFHDYLDLARSTGVRTFWYHSSATKPPAPADPSGCWVPARKSARLRAAVEAEGMNYIDDHYIVDIARRL